MCPRRPQTMRSFVLPDAIVVVVVLAASADANIQQDRFHSSFHLGLFLVAMLTVQRQLAMVSGKDDLALIDIDELISLLLLILFFLLITDAG